MALEVIFGSIFGSALGSFANLCIDRVPAEQSILRPPSHCDGCGRRLAPSELVPVISYLVARGSCKSCGIRIPGRVLLVEGLMAGILGYIAIEYGLGLEMAALSIYALTFITLFFADLEKGILPNRIVYPALLAALGFSLFLPEVSLLGALLGGLLGFVVLLAIYLLSRGGMGEGDVKLGALVGLATGFPTLFPALIIAAIGGGVVAVSLLALRQKRPHDSVPFGPFLVTGAMAALLFGGPILSGWQHL